MHRLAAFLPDFEGAITPTDQGIAATQGIGGGAGGDQQGEGGEQGTHDRVS